MRRTFSLQITFVHLLAVCVGAFLLPQQAHSQDTADSAKKESPGWVVIFAADFAGPDGKLYRAVQRDAIAAYDMAVRIWKVPTDHIILLAEGGDIAAFVQNGLLPPTDDKAAAAVAARVKWPDELEANPSAQIMEAFGRTDMLATDTRVPLWNYPIAESFRLALDKIKTLAQANQFLAIIISSHASPADSSLVMARPDKTGNSLTAEDFNLADCKAGVRLLAIDASNTGAPVENPAALDGKRFDLVAQLDPDKKGRAVVFSASPDAVGSLWNTDKPTPPGPEPLHFTEQSLFLLRFNMLNYTLLFHDKAPDQPTPDQKDQTTWKTFADKLAGEVDFSTRIKGKSIAAKPTYYAEETLLNHAAGWVVPDGSEKPVIVKAVVPVKTNKIALKPEDISSEEQDDLTFQGKKLGIIKIGLRPFGYLTSAPGVSAGKRADIVRDRIREFLQNAAKKGAITPDDLRVIRTDNKAIVLEAAGDLVAGGRIVEIDPAFARRWNMEPRELAKRLRNSLYSLLSVSDRSKIAALSPSEPETAQEFFSQGDDYFRKENWAEAEVSYQKAVLLDGSYTVAYIGLCRSQMKQKKYQEAEETYNRLSPRDSDFAPAIAALKEELKQNGVSVE